MNDFDPDRITVGQLFKDDSRLIIPRFQRSYEWKEANVEEFYNDFVKTSDDNLNFLGNIVLDASKPGYFQIIDGQQRLITITILCAAIRDILREEIKTDLANQLVSKIDSTYLQTGVSFSGSSEQSSYKLTPSKELEDFFYIYVQKGGEAARKILPRTTSHKNVVRAYKRLRKLLSDEKLSSNVDFDQKVKFLEMAMDRIHKIVLITIKIYNQDSAYAIFESFNAKRVDLSVADLVKNYYFSKLKGNENTINRNMDRWDKVILNVTSIIGSRVDKFLHYYLQSKNGKFTRAQLYRRIRIDVDGGPDRFISNLEKATNAYVQLKDSNVQSTDKYFISSECQSRMNSSLEGINSFNVDQCFILLMAIILNKDKLSQNFISKTIELIENFTFIFSKIANDQANLLEQIYSEFAKEITIADMPKDINVYSGQFYSKLKDKLERILPKYESFEVNFLDLDYSNPQQRKLIKYIFEKTEAYNTRGGSILGQFANIDHIFPQNPQGVKRPTRYNKIGNLLPIDRDTNSKVGNKLPKDKIEIYKKVCNITQINDYVEFTEKYGVDMTNELIDERAKEIAYNSYNRVWAILNK